MIAEDDKDDADLLMKALQEHTPFDCSLSVARNGVELMRQLQDGAENGMLPDVVVLDLNMPIKSGYEALIEIRESEALRHIPVVVFTSSLRPQDEDACTRLGCTFMRKPVNFKEYRQVSEEIAGLLKAA